MDRICGRSIPPHHFLRSEKKRLLHKKCSNPIRDFCNQHRWSHGWKKGNIHSTTQWSVFLWLQWNWLVFHNQPWGLDVSLMKNGNMVGAAECNSGPGTEGNWETLSFQLTIPLKAGDQVWTQIIEIGNAVLHDEGRHFVHFNGYMLQEELSP